MLNFDIDLPGFTEEEREAALKKAQSPVVNELGKTNEVLYNVPSVKVRIIDQSQ